MRALACSAFLMLIVCSCGAGQHDRSKGEWPSNSIDMRNPTEYRLLIARQEKLFKAKAEELERLGRIPIGYEYTAFSLEMHIGIYDWHGNLTDGLFGAYSLSKPAYEQARRSWVINGIMLPGSDLLWPTNPNAKFDKSIIGYEVAYIASSGCFADDGNTPCSSEFIYDHSEIRNAKVIGVFGRSYEWDSVGSDRTESHGPKYWDGPLKLDQKASRFMQTYGILIHPPDWRELCGCTAEESGEKAMRIIQSAGGGQ